MKDIRRATRKQYSAEEKIRIVLEGLRGEDSIAYQGVEDGEIVFEVRGYAISDLVHPGSGQMIRVPSKTKAEQILDLAITIVEAKPDSLRYRVIHKKADDFGPPGAANDDRAVLVFACLTMKP